MSRQKKPSGRLHRGPFTAAHFHAALKLDGWIREKDTRHANYSHPSRPGKVQVDDKWTGVKPGHFTFDGVRDQAGYSKRELLLLLNGISLR